MQMLFLSLHCRRAGWLLPLACLPYQPIVSPQILRLICFISGGTLHSHATPQDRAPPS